MKIKKLIKQDAGFQYVVDNLETMSSAGRRVMLDTPFVADATVLQAEWQRLEEAVQVLNDSSKTHAYNDLKHCFMQLHDLQSTLQSLGMHMVLNEVELFEIKLLANLVTKARVSLHQLGMEEAIPLPPLDEVFALLDPDHTGVVNFYIYDSYDERLAPLRTELRVLQEHGGDAARISDLLAQQTEVQQAVCLRLCNSLANYHTALATSMEQMAYGDFLFAKAELAKRWHLVRPTLSSSIDFRALVNPRLRDHNEELGLRYQAVDIEASAGVTLITGANMAGKTVLLKSLGTAQTMVQCGLFAPAQSARTTLFDGVAYSIGDAQNEMNGLSSYASEMITISDIVRRTTTERLLVLVDEPCRTTNPTEGKALVQAIITILEQRSSVSVITTHYGQLGAGCRRLRVRGFVEDMADVVLTPQNISRFIDYSLTPDQADDVPHEALRIAEILGCDSTLLDLARQNLEN